MISPLATILQVDPGEFFRRCTIEHSLGDRPDVRSAGAATAPHESKPQTAIPAQVSLAFFVCSPGAPPYKLKW